MTPRSSQLLVSQIYYIAFGNTIYHPLPAMLGDDTITTVYKVKGGLFTIRLWTDFDINRKRYVSFNFLSGDSEPLTFIEKIIADRQSSNTTDNNGEHNRNRKE